MLQLGLERISKLVVASKLPWRAIHVAGTNGKGSICSYTSRMLRAAGISVGQFTSPHLVDRWDSISLNGTAIDEVVFTRLESQVRQQDQKLQLQCTEFELLAATAFEAFSRARMELGVIEVGVGGLTDATNILTEPLATVIASISRDHEALLGSTLEEIATQKAGIIKPGAPCFVDDRNSDSVKEVITREARDRGASHLEFVPSRLLEQPQYAQILKNVPLAEHQRGNLALALAATKAVLLARGVQIDDATLLTASSPSETKGRLQTLSIEAVTGRMSTALLDGAHNEQSVQALGQYVNKYLRSESQEVTWILAASRGKDVEGMFAGLVLPGDKVITTAFGPVDGMPWVSAVDAEDLSSRIAACCEQINVEAVQDVRQALETGTSLSNEGPLVIAGSLYLASDVLRLLRAHGADTNKL